MATCSVGTCIGISAIDTCVGTSVVCICYWHINHEHHVAFAHALVSVRICASVPVFVHVVDMYVWAPAMEYHRYDVPCVYTGTCGVALLRVRWYMSWNLDCDFNSLLIVHFLTHGRTCFGTYSLGFAWAMCFGKF